MVDEEHLALQAIVSQLVMGYTRKNEINIADFLTFSDFTPDFELFSPRDPILKTQIPF